MTKSSIGFYGGAGAVTGANFLFDTGEAKFLVDCGITQGKRDCDACNYDDFVYNPSEITSLFVTHAHADHIGRIPKLLHDGFTGVIYSTPATKDMAVVMFDDALKLMERDARERSRDPMYTREDIDSALSLWQTKDYHEQFSVADDVSVEFLDAGHVLGSAIVEFTRNGKKVVFTGDLGNSPGPLLPDTEQITGANYMVIESVYGDRLHEAREERTELLAASLREAHARSGTLLIPAFSIQRTQILIYEINKLVESGMVPEIPVYLDSPLAIRITKVFKQYTHLFNEQVQEEMKKGDDIFDFPKFVIVEDAKESKGIAHKKGAKVVLSGSGMSVGGRVLLYEQELLTNPNNIILFVGYQGVGTLGRRIQEGASSVEIGGKRIQVKATTDSIRGFSAHKDRDGLVDFVAGSADTLEQVFVAMGEPKSSLFLAQRLKDFLGVPATVPEKNQVITIGF